MAWTLFTQAQQPSRKDLIAIVNRIVNNGIDPEHGTPNLMDPWRVWPKSGWCHDYAVTKRYELMLRGIPPQLCECIAPDGEHHVVVLVDGVALDNLTQAIAPMRYQVVRTQSLANADFWEKPA